MQRNTPAKMLDKIQKIALRNRALYLPLSPSPAAPLTSSTAHCLQQLRRCGFTLTEDALRAFNALSAPEQGQILETVNDVMGTTLNWNPLVKGWLEPTGEDIIDHLATAYANYLQSHGMWVDGVTLPCGHMIPTGAFNLDRYNGCPFCGKPFRIGDDIFYGQGSKLKELKRWTRDDAKQALGLLAASTVPLDATARENLKGLLEAGIELDNSAEVPVKENAIIIASYLVDMGLADKAGTLLASPADVMRLLWYRHTGQIQIIEPSTLVLNTLRANSDRFNPDSYAASILADTTRKELRLHFDRATCRMAAKWLNGIDMPPAAACATMHPKRGMWTRFIRGLRLSEYARKPGFERLAALLRTWWAEDYAVPQGKIDEAKRAHDFTACIDIMSSHPGLFARQLFSTILWFYPHDTVGAFAKAMAGVPLRLICNLGSQAEAYFSGDSRLIKTITGKSKTIEANPRTDLLSEAEQAEIVEKIKGLVKERLFMHYAEKPEPGVKIYISPQLDSMVLPIGDRSSNVQALSTALQGTRFPLEGDKVRIFLNWGEGMNAAPIDLDISAKIIYPDKVEDCAYYNLSPDGARHSGDIREIPGKVGTAEYIELDVPRLKRLGAEYVVFIASHYSGGTLNVNTRVGWMDSKYPMHVSNETGVAYDPSAVQHMVCVAPTSMTRSLVFGLLDIKSEEIMWLELGSDDQAAFTVDSEGVIALMERLRRKTTVGSALRLMAQARGMLTVETPAEADRVYDSDWALDVPKVIATLL